MNHDSEKLNISDIFASILDALPGHIAILDSTGCIVMVNQAWRCFASENLLQTDNFGVGQNYLNICENASGDSKTDAFMALDAIRSLLNEENEFSAFEYPCHSPVHKRWFRFMATKLVGAYMSGIVIIHVDITERKLIEERLTQQAALIDQASDAIIVRDLKNKIVFWNRRAEKIYGWQSEEVLEKPIKDILYLNSELLDRATDEVINKGKWSGELTHKTKSGQMRTMLCRWNLLYDEEGLPKSILAINTDITERKKVEEQFMRAQRLESIGVLAGGIAHDLNNVLAPIIMSLDILDYEIESVDGKNVLNTLKISAERGAELIKQVLGFARGVGGERLLINITNICHDIQKVIRETFPKNILFELNITPDLWTIVADPTQFHQVIMNMCVNARDAMPDGGKLSISIENVVLDEVFTKMNVHAHPGPYVLIKVDDNGYGMPNEVREKIFEPFFTTKEIGKGTGLGLSTTFSIVRDHGGFINVYSEPGNGTRFKLYFPANTDTNIIADSAKNITSKLPLGNGELILLVDDEESIRDISKKSLEHYGYKVMLAQHGAEAISIFALHRDEIDVVLTDMSMPVMDGPALIVALKSINPEVNIIASSGLATNGYMLKVMQSGVNHFVHKPYTAEALLKVLSEVLNKSEPDGTTENAVQDYNLDKSIINSKLSDGERQKNTVLVSHEKEMAINFETILVVDDNVAMRTIARSTLEKDGYTILEAASAEEALDVMDTHEGTIHMIFTDVHMPGMSGIDLIQEVAKLYPDVKRVLVSGDNSYLKQDKKIPVDYHIIDKPYTISNLVTRIRDILDQ